MPKHKQRKEQVPQRGLKKAHAYVLAVVVAPVSPEDYYFSGFGKFCIEKRGQQVVSEDK